MKRITFLLAFPLLLLTFISQIRAQTVPEPEWQLLTHSFTAMSKKVHVGDVVTTTWAVPVENMVDDDTFYLTFITRSGEILMDAQEPFHFPPQAVDYHFRCGPHYPPHQLSCTGSGIGADSAVVGLKFETEVTACLEGKVVSDGYAVYWRDGQYISEHISSLKLPCSNGGE
ncbi:MAG: hypothetical protein H6658_09960 [Ardenticatenaceae bacterium]|nr:hypothetical protein [Ardenticatenaceae bacterium]